jgi:hypothetical protein
MTCSASGVRIRPFASLFTLFSLLSWAVADDIQVNVDCAQVVDRPLVLTGYFNNSLRNAPPPALAEKTESAYGRPKIVRCWLVLDQMWDYRTGEYRFNWQIGKNYYEGDKVKHPYERDKSMLSEVMFEDYLSAFGEHSQEILLNVRRYEQEVRKGIIGMSKWKEVLKTGLAHYKKEYPNIRYIEALNESRFPHFGGVPPKDYYKFFKVVTEVVNEINAELDPELPLLVGGSADHHPKGILPLVRGYANDQDPNKRLDFVSFHEYWVGKEPVQVAGWERQIAGILKAHGAPADIPIYVTEIAYALPKSDPKFNLHQAAGMTAILYQARHAEQLRLFPWVMYHTPQQEALVMFDNHLRMTPFGAAVKMLSMHKEKEVFSQSSGLTKAGTGLGALATRDESGVAVQVWNYQESPASVQVTIQNVPEQLAADDLKVRHYLIDSKHSNCFSDSSSKGGLDSFRETRQEHAEDVQLSIQLEPMALHLWIIE